MFFSNTGKEIPSFLQQMPHDWVRQGLSTCNLFAPHPSLSAGQEWLWPTLELQVPASSARGPDWGRCQVAGTQQL